MEVNYEDVFNIPPDNRWRNEAACIGQSPNIFVPKYSQDEPTAKRICRTCPVAEECLITGIINDEEGIYGGMNQKQRREFAASRLSTAQVVKYAGY